MTTPYVQSFVLISMPRGPSNTPPSGYDLAVLDYHLKERKHALQRHTPTSVMTIALIESANLHKERKNATSGILGVLTIECREQHC